MSDLGQDAWTIFNNTFFSRVPSLPSPAQAFHSDVPRVVDAIIFRWREVLTATESSTQPLSEHISLCVGGLRNKPYTTSKGCFSHMCDITGPRDLGGWGHPSQMERDVAWRVGRPVQFCGRCGKETAESKGEDHCSCPDLWSRPLDRTP